MNEPGYCPRSRPPGRGARWLLFVVCAVTQAAANAGETVFEQAVSEAIRNNDSAFLAHAIDDDAPLPELTASDGKTVLMAACADDNLALVDRLLAAGADVRVHNERGGTALMYAAAAGSEAIVSRLIDTGADIDFRAENGWTALTLASAKGHAHVVSALLARGADPNIPDVFGYTALMRAAQNGRRDAVGTLLESPRTSLVQINTSGRRALEVARESGHCDITNDLQRAAALRGVDAQRFRDSGNVRIESCDE
ncbi:MAG: ankyrin repeat domain-containing protein [Proteobacteria bacterium]|nr:MAG: ankyrin repeat domain-containing protein [Pseudomonadota bacterium]